MIIRSIQIYRLTIFSVLYFWVVDAVRLTIFSVLYFWVVNAVNKCFFIARVHVELALVLC